MSDQKLFQEFQDVTNEQWLKQIEKDLKGKDFNTLLSKTSDGITIRPTYHQEAIIKEQPFRTSQDWKVVQEILVMDADVANKQALDYLNKGANSLLFYLDDSISLKSLLKDVQLKYINVHFITAGGIDILIEELEQIAKSQNIDYSEVNGSINIDCLENLARTGNWFQSEEQDFQQIKKLTNSNFPNLKSICINANLFTNAGASLSQQIGISLAMAYEYIYKLKVQDANKFWINFGIGGDYFGEISKLRAFRRLWQQFLHELELPPAEAHIYSETATRNKTILDAHNNLIRTSTEAMSAVIGGANEISIKGFNVSFDAPTDFSERISRNQHAILEHESHLNAVKDIAKGSHFIESLTEELSLKAWDFFKDIENNGGFLAALKSGWLQAEVEKSADIEQSKFDNKEKILIGANKHQKADTNLKDIIRYGLFYKPSSKETIVSPMKVKRLSEELEKS